MCSYDRREVQDLAVVLTDNLTVEMPKRGILNVHLKGEHSNGSVITVNNPILTEEVTVEILMTHPEGSMTVLRPMDGIMHLMLTLDVENANYAIQIC